MLEYKEIFLWISLIFFPEIFNISREINFFLMSFYNMASTIKTEKTDAVSSKQSLTSNSVVRSDEEDENGGEFDYVDSQTLMVTQLMKSKITLYGNFL